MRQIKFRAWDKKKSVMETVTGIEFAGSDANNPIGTVLGIKFDNKIPGHAWVPEYDVILMQFTGLLDKNGKEIYEDDIAKVRVKNGESIYHTQAHVGMGTAYEKNIIVEELIGNIYENPELIK